MRDIELRDLEALEAVARHRNFRRAAREQQVSVSSVSQRLRSLEERLGVRLLNRSTRSVAPTEVGEQLLQRILPALQEVADAVTDARGRRDQPAGRLRINAPAPAAELVLAPMVAPFLDRYPGIDLEITVDPSLIDIVAAGYDAGVRYEEHLAQDMIAISLGPPQRYVVVAAPSFLKQHGIPRTPADLLGKPAIGTLFPSQALLPWEFQKRGKTVRMTPRGPFMSGHVGVQRRAAIDGLGFLMTFEGYVSKEVAAGTLVVVLDDWCPRFPGPYLYYPSRRQPPPALRAFLGFVQDWRSRRR
jgi:DNA-binding transcriptional LysR family regulator